MFLNEAEEKCAYRAEEKQAVKSVDQIVPDLLCGRNKKRKNWKGLLTKHAITLSDTYLVLRE